MANNDERGENKAPPSGQSDNPIDVLLNAEQLGEREIEQARERAKAKVDDARDRARRIRERVQTRINAIHAGCAKRVERDVKDRWDAYEQETQTPIENEITPERTRAIAVDLAGVLTGGQDNHGGGASDE